MTTETKGREFEIMRDVAELMDTLKPDQQRQVMAMLAARYGLKIQEPTAASSSGYRPRPKRKF